MPMKTKVFKTIEIGALPKQEILRQLEEQDIYTSTYAKELIEKMPEERIEKVDLVKLTVKELGFTASAKWKEILSKAQELGYEMCPPEVGPILALNWDDQPKGTWAYIGVEPITDSDGYPLVFFVERHDDGKSWLYAFWVYPGIVWNLDYEIVFRLREDAESSETKPLPSGPLNFEARLKSLEAFEKKVRKFLILE